jgi:AraC family transcriptional regulator
MSNGTAIFTIVTGMTVGDYIRSRRLYLSGKELAESDVKVLDTALKYGYETAASFSKAFTRFHGVPPSKIRQDQVRLFCPLTIHITIQGFLLPMKCCEATIFEKENCISLMLRGYDF